MSENFNLFEECVLLDLTFHKPGIRRKANKDNIECDADKDMLGLSKAILDSEEYRAVATVATNCRKWLEKRTGESILKRGTYMVKTTILDEVYAHVEQAKADFMAAADAFMLVYPERQEEARVRLADQYDADNYPEASRLRAAFYVTKRVLDVSPPGSTKVSAALRSKELKQWQEDMTAAGDEIRQTLRQSARDLLATFRERMDAIGGVNEDGKKMRFHPAALHNVTEFLDLFYHRDLTNDTEMQEVCAACKHVLDGVDAKMLKDSDAVRIEVEGETAKIIERLDALLEKAPSRMYFDEEPVEDSVQEPELAGV